MRVTLNRIVNANYVVFQTLACSRAVQRFRFSLSGLCAYANREGIARRIQNSAEHDKTRGM